MKKYRLEIRKGLMSFSNNTGKPYSKDPWVRVVYPATGIYIASLASFITVQEAVDYIGFRIKEREGSTSIELILQQTEIPLELLIRWEKEKSENTRR